MEIFNRSEESAISLHNAFTFGSFGRVGRLTSMSENHTILGGKVHAYKRPNSSSWQCASFLAGKNRLTTTKEDSLSKAREVAEDWYLQPRGKTHDGEQKSGKLLREAAKLYLREFPWPMESGTSRVLPIFSFRSGHAIYSTQFLKNKSFGLTATAGGEQPTACVIRTFSFACLKVPTSIRLRRTAGQA
jgi:hypothetical protein